MSVAYDPIIVTSGSARQVSLKNPDILQGLILQNKSSYDLRVSGIDSAGVRWQPAGTADRYIADSGCSGTISIEAVNTANLVAPPPAVVLITTYTHNEKIPAGQYPVTIPTQAVQTTVSAATGIVNDGAIPSTQFVEVTPQGSSGSTYSFANDGTMFIKAYNLGTLTNLLLISGGAAPRVNIAVAGIVTEILGTLSVDQLASFVLGVNVSGAIHGFNNLTIDLLTTLTGAVTMSSTSLYAGLATFTAGLTSNAVITGTVGLTISGGVTSLDGGLIATDNAGRLNGRIFAHDKNNANSGFYGADSVNVAHKLIHLNVVDNDVHAYASSNNLNFKISKSDASGDIAVFNDTTGLTMAKPIKILRAQGHLMDADNIVAGDQFGGTAGTGGVTVNHNFKGGTPNITVFVGTAGPSTATGSVNTITSTQVTVYQNATLTFSGFSTQT